MAGQHRTMSGYAPLRVSDLVGRAGCDARSPHAMVTADEQGWLDEHLRSLGRNGWTAYYFGVRRQPDAIAFVRRLGLLADVFVLRGPDDAAAFRTRIEEHGEPLTASLVVWAYVGAPARTLRCLLALPAGDHPELCVPYPIPPACRVPELDRRPYTIRRA